MTCEEVRALLPEHLLGTSTDTDDARVRRHLRGCGECRAERTRLEDGVAALSYATEQEPPEEVRAQVLGALDDEWHAPDEEAPSPTAPARSPWRWLAVAAAAVLIAVSIGWGASQARRADTLAADASSYQSLLDTLGGKEFRLGSIRSADGTPMDGTVVLYDGEPGKDWNSWGIVLAHAASFDGTARAMLVAGDGRTLELSPLRFRDGEASTWLVTHDDLTGYDELVITAHDGTVLANARIASA